MPDETVRDLASQASYYAANQARWDESVAIHAASEGYDLAGFLRGEKSLYPVEMDEVGDVAGKALLHLQCHFGMDTLNWARLGATVTGLDFSPVAVARARALAAQIGVADARFVEANIYEADAVLREQFDVVYTGIGALCWLHDINAWARIAAGFVKPGGFLYVYDHHPMFATMDEERTDGELRLRYSYFETSAPAEWHVQNTYVDGPPLQNTRRYEWSHGLSEIATAIAQAGIAQAGLRVDFLHEHREIAWQALPWLIPIDGQGADSRYARRTAWRLPDSQRDLCPLMFSLKATKPR